MLTCSAWDLLAKFNPILYLRNQSYHFCQLITVLSNSVGVCSLTECHMIYLRSSLMFLYLMEINTKEGPQIHHDYRVDALLKFNHPS